VPVIAFLQEERIPFLMPVVFRGRRPKRGQPRRGLHLIKRRPAGWYRYLLRRGKRTVEVSVGDRIAHLIGRPAQYGHIGEFVTAAIFDIELAASASHKGIDGHFRSGSLTGESVNIKYYARREGVPDISVDGGPDYYLVLTGPAGPAISSRGRSRPWVIAAVYLFHAPDLIAQRHEFSERRGRKTRLGIGTSIPNGFWTEAEIYPESRSSLMTLTDEQRLQLALFAPRPYPSEAEAPP